MSMTLIEKLFALRDLPGFGQLHESELTVIAQVALERELKKGEAFCRKGQVLQRLTLVVGGTMVKEDCSPAPRILGAGSLLYNIAAKETLRASPEHGARCLIIRKPHFFTMIYQCSSLLRELLNSELIEGEPAK